MKHAVFFFEESGNMAKPWRDAGWNTLSFDIAHGIRKPDLDSGVYCDLSSLGPALTKLKERGVDLRDVGFFAAFPPCTHIAVCGARDFATKGLRALQESVGYFATCQEFASLLDCPWMIENPVSSMATHWRKPDHYFHPADYTAYELGDNYTKKTSIWCGNGFVMPDHARDLTLGPPDDRIHKATPGHDRGSVRSQTPMGFARATFEANRRAWLEAQE